MKEFANNQDYLLQNQNADQFWYSYSRENHNAAGLQIRLVTFITLVLQIYYKEKIRKGLRAPRIRSSSFFSAGKMLFANLRVRLIISSASEYFPKLANALHSYAKWKHIKLFSQTSKQGINRTHVRWKAWCKKRSKRGYRTNVNDKIVVLFIFKNVW